MNIFSGIFPVCYGQFYLLSDVNWDGDLTHCFSRQQNGLCGVSYQGVVFFITGLHTGNITLNVNSLTTEPKLDKSKEEIVEASFVVSDSAMILEAWGEALKQDTLLPPGEYRIRYSAINFGAAEDLGKFEDGDIECYDVDIWPAPYAEDKIIKVTSEQAKYWHSEIRKHQE